MCQLKLGNDIKVHAYDGLVTTSYAHVCSPFFSDLLELWECTE